MNLGLRDHWNDNCIKFNIASMKIIPQANAMQCQSPESRLILITFATSTPRPPFAKCTLYSCDATERSYPTTHPTLPPIRFVHVLAARNSWGSTM